MTGTRAACTGSHVCPKVAAARAVLHGKRRGADDSMTGDPIDSVDEGDLVGGPLDDAPKIDAGRNCNGRQSARVSSIIDDENDTKIGPDVVDVELLDEFDPSEHDELGDHDPKVFVGYCGSAAGMGTQHPGDGRCKFHGGCSLRGRDHPQAKHLLFSEVMNDEDRAVYEGLEHVSNPDMLDHLIRLNMTQLRRAVDYMTDDEDDARNFFDAFEQIVTEARASGEAGLDNAQIRELANLLGSGQQAMGSKMDLVRRLILAHSKITDGEQVNIDASTELSGGASLAVEWATVDEALESDDD